MVWLKARNFAGKWHYSWVHAALSKVFSEDRALKGLGRKHALTPNVQLPYALDGVHLHANKRFQTNLEIHQTVFDFFRVLSSPLPFLPGPASIVKM